MFGNFRLGRAFGIDLFVHWSFWLLPAWLFLSNLQPAGLVASAGWVVFILAVFACVLLHELGHALMAARFGIPTRDITLYPIGGVARLARMGRRPSEELLVALAGPAVNVVIAVVLGVGLAALGLPVLEPVGVNVWPVFPQALFMTNVGLVVFNLLPAFPMDGGRVLRALLEIGIGRLPATQVAALVGAGLALLIGVGGLFSGNLMLCFLAGMVFLLGQQELAAVSLQERRPVGPTVLDMLPAGPLSIDPASYPARPGFSGFTWDARNRLWVEWRDGRPVGGVAVDRS